MQGIKVADDVYNMLELCIGWIVGVVMAQELRFPNVVHTVRNYFGQKTHITIAADQRHDDDDDDDDEFNMD